MASKTANTVVGVAMIVFGILLILGRLGLQQLLPFAGLVLTVVGILVLIKTLPGGVLVGVVALVLGILLMGNWVKFPTSIERILDPVLETVNLIAGVVLLVVGIIKLREG